MSESKEDVDVQKKQKVIFASRETGPLDVNMSIVGDPETKEAVIIDPGGHAKQIMKMVEDLGVKIVVILLTHAHFDHCLGVPELVKSTGAPLWVCESDEFLYNMLPVQLGMFRIPASNLGDIPKIDKKLQDGDKLPILDGKVIHTPGHSPGSVCFYFEKAKLLITGDTLFKYSVGRSDLWGGDASALKESIVKKLYVLPDDVQCIPGHGEKTTIKDEKKHNIFVKG